MSKILVGVDAGTYTFTPSANQITISGISGLVLQSIQMVVDQTTGKMLYIFNELPATFIANVLTLNAATDLAGCQSTDALSIYVNSPYIGTSIFNNSKINVVPDISTWVKSAQTTLTSNYSIGPFEGTKSTRLQITGIPDNPGCLGSIQFNKARSDGCVPIFSIFVKGTGNFQIGTSLYRGYGNYVDGGNAVYAAESDWKRYVIAFPCYVTDIDTFGVVIKAATGGDIDIETWNPQLDFDTFTPTDISTNRLLPTQSYQNIALPARPKQELTSVAMFGDSLTAGAYGFEPRSELSSLLNGSTVFNGGVGGETSTQIKTRFDADTTHKKYGIVIIWAGRNDFSNVSTVVSNISGMVAGVGHGRFLVGSVLNGVGEISGGASYNFITSINSTLQNKYGTRYVDIRSKLCAGNLNDMPNTEFMADGIHPNGTGHGIVACEFYKAIKLNDWL